MPCCPGRGSKQAKRNLTLTLLMQSFWVSVFQEDATASPLCYGIFTMVSCLYIAASWSSCEGDKRQATSVTILMISSPFLFVLDKCY